MSTQQRVFVLCFCAVLLSFARADFECVVAGYFADSEDCHAYYSCDKNLVSTHLTCTTYGYFDTTTGNCEVGPCPTLEPPVTTPTTTATTKKTTTAFVFVCPAAGYFADPKDCRKYYVCDDDFVASHYICMGGGGHWEDDQKACVSGKC